MVGKYISILSFFFFQAEDGIRDKLVTGVQTCALPISFHEGINFAAVLKVPIVFVVQNNQVALGTPVEKHSRGPLEALRQAYGLDGLSCEGNNVLDVYAATRLLVERCRRGGGPLLLYARTIRMG